MEVVIYVFMFMCLCLREFMYICFYVRRNVLMYVVCMYECVYVCMYECMNICINTLTSAHAQMRDFSPMSR